MAGLAGGLTFNLTLYRAEPCPIPHFGPSFLSNKLLGDRLRIRDDFCISKYSGVDSSSSGATIAARYGGNQSSYSGRSSRSGSNYEGSLNMSTIKSNSVRLIGADQNMLGVVSKGEAALMAENAGLDLVIVAPEADPPVVRMMDYSKYKYEQQKKKKEQQKMSPAGLLILLSIAAAGLSSSPPYLAAAALKKADNDTIYRDSKQLCWGCLGESLQFLFYHNLVRAAKGELPLTWDAELERYARWWAGQRRADCKAEHSFPEGGFKLGENIYWGSGGAWTPYDAVAAWAGEERYYSYPNNSCQEGQLCGHYTQIVWRSTRRMGCSRIVCDDGDVFMNCNYDPVGNYEGERPY